MSTTSHHRALCRCLNWYLSLGLACMLSCWCAQVRALDADAIDLPPCEANVPGRQAGVALGLAQPYADPAVLAYVAKLAASRPQISVCSESWHEVVPRFAPWANQLERGYGFGAFVLTLLLALALLSALTPRRWWQRATLTGVLAVGGVTWLLACLLLAGFHALGGQRLVYGTAVSLRLPQQAQAEWLNVAGARELEALLAARKLLPPVVGNGPAGSASAVQGAALDAQPRQPGGAYRVWHRLNLREAAGVQSTRIATLAIGAVLQYDGAQAGDWWRVRTGDGRVGWVSSLWLRSQAGAGRIAG